MPFRSEKQRRFMWAEHPSLAKRWAHEYPESNKGLPMYADKKPTADSKEKTAALTALSAAIDYFSGRSAYLTGSANAPSFSKESLDKLERVQIPHSDKPTYAGQEREQGEQKLKENESDTAAPPDREKCDENGAKEMLAKISAVLAQPFREQLEAQQALAEGRDPRFVPNNMGLKRYSIPSPYVTPPMGMVAPPANASAAQGAQAAQQNMPQPGNTPVGGGANPQHNPIQAFGPLGAKGQLNGNAAFGQKNSPDSAKSAGITSILGGSSEKLPGWYGAEGLVDVGGAYRYGHTHGVDVVDQKPGWLRRIFDRDPYVLREDVPKYKRKLKAIRGMHVMEQPYRLEFSHMGQLKPEMRQLIEAALSKQSAASPAWQRSEGKNPEGGLNEKGRKSYEKAHGGNLKPPVTESNPSGDRKKRQNSFCSRMCGMKRVNTGSKTKSDPDSRINKSLRKWNCKCGSAQDLLTIALGDSAEKISIDVARGGLPAMALASTLGHVGAFPGGTILSRRTHVNPTDWTGAEGITDAEPAAEDTRAQRMQQLAQTMAQADPQALSDHQVYLGGPRFFRELKRTLTNPRTSVLGKTVGTLGLPGSYLSTALTRGSAYNPWSNSTYLYGDSPAVLSHELGHALDFNASQVPQYEPGKNKLMTWLRRQGTGIKRDLYGLAGNLPIVSLLHEASANQRSERALRKVLGDKPGKLNEILHDRQKVLPAGYGSYVGKTLGGPGGALLGLAGGKAYGLAQGARRKGTYAEQGKDKPEDSNSDRDESESKAESKAKSKSKSKAKAKSKADSAEKISIDVGRLMARTERDFLEPQRNVTAVANVAAPIAVGTGLRALGHPVAGLVGQIGTQGVTQHRLGKLNARIRQLDKQLAPPPQPVQPAQSAQPAQPAQP